MGGSSNGDGGNGPISSTPPLLDLADFPSLTTNSSAQGSLNGSVNGTLSSVMGGTMGGGEGTSPLNLGYHPHHLNALSNSLATGLLQHNHQQHPSVVMGSGGGLQGQHLHGQVPHKAYGN